MAPPPPRPCQVESPPWSRASRGLGKGGRACHLTPEPESTLWKAHAEGGGGDAKVRTDECMDGRSSGSPVGQANRVRAPRTSISGPINRLAALRAPNPHRRGQPPADGARRLGYGRPLWLLLPSRTTPLEEPACSEDNQPDACRVPDDDNSVREPTEAVVDGHAAECAWRAGRRRLLGGRVGHSRDRNRELNRYPDHDEGPTSDGKRGRRPEATRAMNQDGTP